MNMLNRITELKVEINDLVTKKTRLEGQFDAIKKRMLEEYDTTDIQQFITDRDALEKKKQQAEEEINKILTETEEYVNKMRS